jgi:DmsE family decaheme c-type cytochrome
VVCETCHGDGTAHIEAGGDPTLIVKPAGFPGSQLCLTCHDLTTHETSRRQGIHANSTAVNCLSCHSIHHAEPRAKSLLAGREMEVCGACHGTYVAGLRDKPFGHRVGRGGMECSSCHEPHARVSREPVRRARSGEAVCTECHQAQRGPFVFPHGANEAFEPGRECMSCHEVHGSNNPKQLRRANVWQLCTECHSPITADTLGSQPPSFHNLSLPRYRQCTTCHVAVHGSNRSPQLLK